MSYPSTGTAMLAALNACLRAGLSGLVGTRVYTGLAPQGEGVYPRVVLHTLSGEDELTHAGGTVPQWSVQLSCQSRRLADCAAVRDAAKGLLHGFSGEMHGVYAGAVWYDGESTAYADDQGIFILPVDFTVVLQPDWPEPPEE